MAVIAVFGNASVLAAELEEKQAILQAIKEGRLPSYAKEVYGTPDTPAPEPVTTVDAAAITVPAVPAVPSL